MAAIGCKYGIVLIFDMLAKEVVRSFSMYPSDETLDPKAADELSYRANIDADQFGVYRKVQFAYADDDFVYH